MHNCRANICDDPVFVGGGHWPVPGWDPPPVHGTSHSVGSPLPPPTFLLQNLRADNLPVLGSWAGAGRGSEGVSVEGDLSLTAGPTEAKAVWVGGPGSAHSGGGRGGMCWLSEPGRPMCA